VIASRSVPPIRRLVPAALSVTIAVGLLAIALPRVTGTSWSTTAGSLLSLSGSELCLLTVVWLAGLFVHTYVMVVPLPGLGHGRAMMLNFSGSAVANIIPFGGVAGMGVNYSMLRSWGFSRNEFTLMTLFTTAWTIMVRLVLPSVAMALLMVAGRGAIRSFVIASLGGLGLVGLIAAMARLMWGRSHTRTNGPAGRRVTSMLDRVMAATTGDFAAELRSDAVAIVRDRWRQLTLGSLGYALLQALLLGLCLRTFGSHLSAVEIFAGFAVGSLLTLVPITPGGIGLSETGMVALLIALGGEPAATTAAVLLFRTFTYLLEIPAGAICGAVWWFGRSQRGSTRHAATPASR
jgi:putative heme transporter